MDEDGAFGFPGVSLKHPRKGTVKELQTRPEIGIWKGVDVLQWYVFSMLFWLVGL